MITNTADSVELLPVTQAAPPDRFWIIMGEQGPRLWWHGLRGANDGETVHEYRLSAESAHAEGWQRIAREQYPEIIQAARWMDDDNGTPHFEPGIGFIVDDLEGLVVPTRWVPHLDAIEQALAGLDHEQPHPLDADTIAYLAREGKEPVLTDSAAYCFVSGEHTPMTVMANSSRELFIASRFFNERFEGWEFDPSAGFTPPTSAEGWPSREAVEEAERRGEQRAIARLTNVAREIAWQAGVGDRETAGAIVSYLATSPNEIAPFMDGKLSPIDFAGDWMRGGCLSWHAMNGSIVHPGELAATSEESSNAG